MKSSLTALCLSALLFAAGCMGSSSSVTITPPHADAGKHAYITPDDDTFDKLVVQSSQPVLVDFTATWCGPCQKLAPSIAELAVEFEGRATVAKVDVDASPKTAEKYGIESMPTMLFFKDGKVVDKVEGFAPGVKDELAAKLTGLLK